MSNSLPAHIDAAAHADRGVSLRGSLPVAGFHRLAEWLAGTEGTLAFKLDFGRDEQGRRRLAGHASGELELLCERCGHEYRMPLDLRFELILVASEAEADLLPEALDAVTIGDRRSVHIVDLLEDELILAVPLVPRCEDVRPCRPAVELLDSAEALREHEEGARQHPFAALAGQKGPKKQ